MTLRTSQRTICFEHPFALSAMDGPIAGGSYMVETDEELIAELSFPVWRRTATRLFLPARPGSTTRGEVVSIDPLELDQALERDTLGNTDSR